MALPVGMLQARRANESEADRLAVSMTAAAGYDPEGMALYIRRVQQDPADALASRAERVEAIEQAIQALPAKNYAASGDFARIQEQVRRALPPSPPKPTLER